jgi:hypothetical protein
MSYKMDISHSRDPVSLPKTPGVGLFLAPMSKFELHWQRTAVLGACALFHGAWISLFLAWVS